MNDHWIKLSLQTIKNSAVSSASTSVVSAAKKVTTSAIRILGATPWEGGGEVATQCVVDSFTKFWNLYKGCDLPGAEEDLSPAWDSAT